MKREVISPLQASIVHAISVKISSQVWPQRSLPGAELRHLHHNSARITISELISDIFKSFTFEAFQVPCINWYVKELIA